MINSCNYVKTGSNPLDAMKKKNKSSANTVTWVFRLCVSIAMSSIAHDVIINFTYLVSIKKVWKQ